MHPAVFQEFDKICRVGDIGDAVLEIGATPDESTLLNLPALARTKVKVGINKAGASRFKDFAILPVDANFMICFQDRCFDLVLCNAVLEHDPFFWRSLAEIRRVTKSGGRVILGAPGYGQYPFEKTLRRILSKIPRPFRPADGWPLQHSTLTLGVHNFPGDYYRFTEQAFREVLFDGMKDVVVRTLLVPPRIIGCGVKT